LINYWILVTQSSGIFRKSQQVKFDVLRRNYSWTGIPWRWCG